MQLKTVSHNGLVAANSRYVGTLFYFNVSKSNETTQDQLSSSFGRLGKLVIRHSTHKRLYVFRDNCCVNLLSSSKQADITAVNGRTTETTGGHVAKSVAIASAVSYIVAETIRWSFSLSYSILRL
jgi:hypothetical protein